MFSMLRSSSTVAPASPAPAAAASAAKEDAAAPAGKMQSRRTKKTKTRVVSYKKLIKLLLHTQSLPHHTEQMKKLLKYFNFDKKVCSTWVHIMQNEVQPFLIDDADKWRRKSGHATMSLKHVSLALKELLGPEEFAGPDAFGRACIENLDASLKAREEHKKQQGESDSSKKKKKAAAGSPASAK